jgi:hypothetical protein
MTPGRPASSVKKASAGGQAEQPWLVKNSTTTGDCALPECGAAATASTSPKPPSGASQRIRIPQTLRSAGIVVPASRGQSSLREMVHQRRVVRK